MTKVSILHRPSVIAENRQKSRELLFVAFALPEKIHREITLNRNTYT